MARNKKDHIVPQFYLRNFALSLSAEKKLIALYHLERQRFQPHATIANEAYEKNFNRNESVQRLIHTIETEASKVIAAMLATEVRSPFRSPDHDMLIKFTFLQSQRTPAALSDARQQQEVAIELIKDKEGKQSARATKFSGIALNSDVAIATLRFVLDLSADLRCKLLRNCTDTPYITSDNPVVAYNQLYQSDRRSTNAGIGCRGLQIFLPLSPRIQLIFFDPEVYRVGGKKLKTSAVDVRHQRDVDALNLLQLLNAHEDLYFSDGTAERYVRSLARKAESIRASKPEVSPRTRFQCVVQHRLFDLIAIGKITHRLGLRFQCISMLKTAAKYVSLPPHLRERNAALARSLESQALSDDES